MSWNGYGWRPYVPVARRRAQAAQQMERLRKKGADIQPVKIAGRKIACTFWGESWCEHLERFSDYANRLPRGRTYVRNGSVCHLGITKGRIEAKVSGSSLYTVKIDIQTLPAAKWKGIRVRCAGQVGSLLELLQGKLSDRVMEIVTDRDQGLFPSPKEIKLSCSCPDWATMCKHVAAVLYGVGARLDEKPELLFLLRGVDHQELVSADTAKAVVAKGSRSKGRTLDESSLTDVFGIELGDGQPPAAAKPARRKKQPPPAPAVTGEAPAKPRRLAKAKPVVAKTAKTKVARTKRGRAKSTDAPNGPVESPAPPTAIAESVASDSPPAKPRRTRKPR